MRRAGTARRVVLISAAVLVAVVVGAIVLGTATVRRAWPQVSGEIALEGINARVSVSRDATGVPTITADTPGDLFRAQGFVDAQDRFFVMDLRRHIASGTLAELVGASGLTVDRTVRTMGWRAVAEAELPTLTPSTRLYLGAYADGVNDYLARAGDPANLAVEYTVLGAQLPEYQIQKWSPVDSLVWLKAMAYDLRGNFADELARARLTASLGPELVADLYPAYPADQHRSILSAGDWPTSSRANSGMPPALTAEPLLAPVTPSVPVVDLADPGVDAAMTAAAGALGALTALLGHGEGGGSNSWVIGPQKSATGKPLLANDPHLGVAIPSIWSQVGLQCRTVGPECPFAVAGFSLAGVPGVVIGHNDSLAWGFTNLGPDVTDFYLEKVTDAAYLRDGAMVPLEVRVETLKVRGGEDASLTARRTVHGPIVSDVMSGPAAVGQRAVLDGIVQPDSYAVSLAWTGLVPSTSADALFAINLARDPAALRSAAKGFAVPSQNIVFADTVGNIGYQAPGLIPVRRAPSPSQPAGYLPVPGWDSQLDWQGWVAFEDLPWALNPRDGFIVAANQQVSATTPPFLTTEWDAGWRSQRIREQITAAAPGSLTVQMMSAIQSDDTDGFAATLVPALLAIDLSGDPFTQSAQDLLRAWDHTTPTGSSLDQQERSASSAAAYFYTVWVTLLDAAFNDQVPAELRADGGSRWRLVVRRLLDQPTSNWWDDKRTASIVEGRDEILRHALVEARLALTKSLGADVSSWSWGRLHTLTLRHPVLGGASLPGPVQALVNRGPVPLPGSSAVVNANGWNATEGYAVNWAPSMRMVVDLGDLDASRWVNQSGQSGHPYHPHYVDQFDAWAAGETFPWPFTPSAVAAARADELTLVPKP